MGICNGSVELPRRKVRLGVRCANLHYHKMRIRSCPGERVLFGIEKTIDDDRVALSRASTARPCSFAVYYVRSSVYCHTIRIMKDNLAAVRRSTLRSRLNLRCASKPSRERKLNARRRTLVRLTAGRVQLL